MTHESTALTEAEILELFDDVSDGTLERVFGEPVTVVAASKAAHGGVVAVRFRPSTDD